MVRAGGKYGSPQYQVRLARLPKTKVGDILSEGEQACVALAAFLTELATAPHHSTLVFDDPVSMLDHHWRARVAARLVEEAERRQVIVFTHDLVLVTELDDLALSAKRPILHHTLARGPHGCGIVEPGLPWSGGRVASRLDALESDAHAVEHLYDRADSEAYSKAVKDVYRNLRSAWERAIEQIAFARVVERHRPEISARHLRKVTALNESDCDALDAGLKKCSSMIESNDRAGDAKAYMPAPQEVMRDVEQLVAWIGSLRERQKKLA